MSTLKVDTILKRTGTGTITLGQSGDTISVPTGASLSLQGGSNGQALTTNGSGTLSFATVGGENAPYFFASVTSNQSVNHDTTTKCNFDRADVDSASGYDTTNKRYTIPSDKGGYWHIGYTVTMDASGEYIKNCYVYPKKNGSDFPSFNSRHQGVQSVRHDSYPDRNVSMTKSFIGNLSASDYIEIHVNYGDSRGGGNSVSVGEYYSCFWGYRLVQ